MLHKGGGLPVPWLLDQPEHILAELIRLTNDILDDVEAESEAA